MHKLILLFFIAIGFHSNSQSIFRGADNYLDTISKMLKPSGDSIARLIDGENLLKTQDDTVFIRSEDDPGTIAGTYIEQFYCDNSGVLKKAVVYRYLYKTWTFYYDSNILIKALVKNLETQELKQFYYGKIDYNLNSYTTNRIAQVYPEFADYFQTLDIGKSFLQQMSKKQ